MVGSSTAMAVTIKIDLRSLASVSGRESRPQTAMA
jgi:hypothetical protein